MSLKSPENIVRLLGMSGFSVRAELRNVEKQFGINVLRAPIEKPDKDQDYYPQFESAVRAEAAWMSEHYEVFYCLERSIRQLVEQVLTERKGASWWDTCVTEKIRNDAKGRQETEIDEAVTARSDNLIDYVTFGELGEIIKQNWADFVDLFGSSQKALTKVLKLLNTLRGPIAHCSPLPEDEIGRLRQAVRDWFRLME
jgi:hypothetical protein